MQPRSRAVKSRGCALVKRRDGTGMRMRLSTSAARVAQRHRSAARQAQRHRTHVHARPALLHARHGGTARSCGRLSLTSRPVEPPHAAPRALCGPWQEGDAAHRSACRSAWAVRERGRPSAMHSTAAVAAAAVVACASLLGLAAVLSPRGAAAPSAALQGATTFVWATDDGPGGAGPPPAARSSVQRQGASATAARGRLAAVKRAARNAEPMGFDISRTLDSAFRRGEQGSTSLIHIDLPIQQYQIGKTVGGGKANMRAYNGDGTALPIYLRLNKVEAATLKEEKQVRRTRAPGVSQLSRR